MVFPEKAETQKKPARRLAFSCPKAGKDLLLCFGSSGSRSSGGSGSRGSGGSGSRGGGGSGSRSSGGSGSRGSGGSGSRSSGSSGSGFSGLRSFNLGRFSGLRGFGFATSGHSQGEEGSYEERVLHFSEILNVMELLGQLVDRNVAVSVNE